LTAATTASPPSVITDLGLLWATDSRKARSSQTYESRDWSEMMPQPKNAGVWWWVSPTKGTNGMPYLLVRYVVSKTTTSPWEM